MLTAIRGSSTCVQLVRVLIRAAVIFKRYIMLIVLRKEDALYMEQTLSNGPLIGEM